MRSSSGGGGVSSLLAGEDGCRRLGADDISSAGPAMDMLRPRVQHACCCCFRQQQQQQTAAAMRLPSNYVSYFRDVSDIPQRFDWFIDDELLQTMNYQKPFFGPQTIPR